MKIPSPLRVLQNIRLHMQAGRSVSSSITLATSATSDSTDSFIKSLKIWKTRIESGQKHSEIICTLGELSRTSGRRAFVMILEKGLKGSPIDENLGELEKEFFQIAENDFDKRLQILPLKMMLPLILLILPGVMALLVGPLLYVLGQGF